MSVWRIIEIVLHVVKVLITELGITAPTTLLQPIVESIVPILLIAAGLSVLYLITLGILKLAATWKMFRAAGDKGWKSLIPFLNSFTIYKLTWNRTVFWVVLILSISAAIITAIGAMMGVIVAGPSLWKSLGSLFGGSGPSWSFGDFVASTGASVALFIILGIAAVLLLALCVLWIMTCFHISKAYNHGFGFFLGLLFFFPFFYLIIGFESGLTYVGNAAARRDARRAAKKGNDDSESDPVLREVFPETPIAPIEETEEKPEADRPAAEARSEEMPEAEVPEAEPVDEGPAAEDIPETESQAEQSPEEEKKPDPEVL